MQDRNRDAETIVRQAFDRTLETQPRGKYPVTMKAGWLRTPLGSMLAVGNDDHLYMLSFMELANTERKTALIQKRLRATLDLGDSESINSVRDEVNRYFSGKLREFKTPLRFTGTQFQNRVWEELYRVPYGNTVSYAELAVRIGKPAAFRAVAQANAQNPIHIIVPCHRVINSDGGLGGYAAGQERKQWLLDFERKNLIKDGVTDPA